MQHTTVEPGTRLTDRYRLEERVTTGDAFTTWRAVDEKLSRAVAVHVLPSSHRRATTVVEAAQAAAVFNDRRFCQVFDVGQQDDITYVVEECPHGTYLTALLENGPLPPYEAATLIHDVAAALAGAHQAGLAHLCLNPATVLRTESGQTKIFGLSVEAALQGIVGAGRAASGSGANGSGSGSTINGSGVNGSGVNGSGVNGSGGPAVGSEDPATVDARRLGALLYSCLTARWPDGPAYGLTAAPREHGVLCSPRQVRAGVPSALDSIAIRALDEPSAHGSNGSHQRPPLRTPAEVAAELAGLPRPRREVPKLPSVPVGPPSAALVATPMTAPTSAGPGSRSGKVVGTLVAALLLTGVTLFAATVLREDGFSGLTKAIPGTSGKLTQVTGKPLAIASVTDFDPQGAGSEGQHENAKDVERTHDGDLSTMWHTATYFRNAHFGGLKNGVGLIIDLGQAQEVHSVKVIFDQPGASVELRAADSTTTSPPPELGSYRIVAPPQSDAATTTTFTLTQPKKTRSLLVWLTSLPSAGSGSWRSGVAEISVHS